MQKIIGLAAVIVTLSVLSSCGWNTEPPPAAPVPAPLASVPLASDIDQAFLQAMVPHHEMAIEMATLAGQKAKNPALKTMAGGIIRTQRDEIATMRKIHLRLFGGELEPDLMAHDRLGMTMTESGMNMDMALLGQAADFDRMFAEQMTQHHQGAINMARKVMAQTTDEEIRTLAESIIAAQTGEIAALAAVR